MVLRLLHNRQRRLEVGQAQDPPRPEALPRDGQTGRGRHHPRVDAESAVQEGVEGRLQVLELYRFLFPQSADFTVKKNPYREHAQTEIFNPKRPGYSTWTGSF